EKNTDEASNRDLFNKLNKLKKSIEHLFENGEIFSTKNVNSNKIWKEIPGNNEVMNSDKIINEKIKSSLKEIYEKISSFIDSFSNESIVSKGIIASSEHFLDTTNVSKEKASIPNSLEELARSKNFLIGKNKLISNNSDAFGKYVSKIKIEKNEPINNNHNLVDKKNIEETKNYINNGVKEENVNSKIEVLINKIISVAENKNNILMESKLLNKLMYSKLENKDILSKIGPLENNINTNESDKLQKVLNTLEKFINKLENGNHGNEVAKLLNDRLIAKYTGEGGEIGKLNFINTNKEDKLFREIFLKNNKQKDAKEGTSKEVNNIDTSRVHRRALADHDFNRQNIEKTKNHGHEGGRAEQLLAKESQLNNNNSYIRMQQMQVDSNLTDKNVFELRGDQLSSPRLIKDIANKIVEYVKFVKESNHSKAELKIAMEDIGKVKILLTDNNDSIKAKIFLDNDNLKHLITTAFESIKGNLVQKGVNISEYNFFNFSREHNNKREHEEDKSGKKFASKKIEKIREEETKLNALYA
ncbi:MAG: hypothetical protein SVN78_10140, partial [Deferribacterota bacterium]|nr:hypothetical protein [Deferribacterota bacterium]